jgi:hypothetical protein
MSSSKVMWQGKRLALLYSKSYSTNTTTVLIQRRCISRIAKSLDWDEHYNRIVERSST